MSIIKHHHHHHHHILDSFLFHFSYFSFFVVRTRCLSRITGASRRGGNATRWRVPFSFLAEHDATILTRLPFILNIHSFQCIPVIKSSFPFINYFLRVFFLHFFINNNIYIYNNNIYHLSLVVRVNKKRHKSL